MVRLVVSRIEAGFATLITDDHHFLELPLHVCDPSIEVGTVIYADITRNEDAERENLEKVSELQKSLLKKYEHADI
ncbi:hypothetical protein SARC_04474 [Sphaeroforma arctica JP610]|uniref:DUF3006 domain-containing protein n=1 Tax=Sphaeroforma arctica JP610 TaxID=667725 RepID=A0A0L0G4U2_9EUKA|nr:hypothetical protein SARC_04474 [Sphaeroforma arctica JP610]KNC83278.1 hypothetical protein SARC_04474 [Sphaeroforma arctica JP610]|eukprot:XP_014157180.1 hypothetical protein SARC_04474 [Sphaeroforma arctica JP610]